jgi:hypothetical protein
MATKTSNAAGLRKFRHDYAQLKKKGLVPHVDARGVKPTKSRLRTLAKYRSVLQGTSAVAKLPLIKAREYVAANKGATLVSNARGGSRVILPISKGDKISVSHGRVKIRMPLGIERVQLPIKFHNLEQWANGIKKNAAKIDAMKAAGERFAFNFAGHHSLSFFDSIDDLIDTVLEYPTFEDAIDSDDAETQSTVYSMIEIVKFPRGLWPEPSATRKQQTAAYQKERRTRRRKNRPAYKKELENEITAQRMREYRAKMKEKNPSQYNAYKAAARERADESRSQKNIKASKKKGKK